MVLEERKVKEREKNAQGRLKIALLLVKNTCTS